MFRRKTLKAGLRRFNGSLPRHSSRGVDLSAEDFVFAREIKRVEFRIAEANVRHPGRSLRERQNDVAATKLIEDLQTLFRRQITTPLGVDRPAVCTAEAAAVGNVDVPVFLFVP